MTLQQQLQSLFSEKPVHEFDPAETLSQSQQLLESHYTQNASGDPRQEPNAVTACNEYGFGSQLFFNNGFYTAAESLLLGGWARFCNIQQTAKQRIYKAGIAMYLTHMYLRLNDRGAAFRWALLTQIDDLLGRHTAGGGAGRQLLHTALGMSLDALDELRGVAENNLQILAQRYDNDWSSHVAFPEDVVVKIILRNPSWSHLLALPTTVYEYPINTSYFSGLLQVHTTTTKEKGDVYEDIASYLITLVPGWLPRRNLLDKKLG
jgi:hypothetical protein